MTVRQSVVRLGAVAGAVVLLSISVRACQSLPEQKAHPVYSFVAETPAALLRID